MSLQKDIATGFRGYGKSFELIFNKGLWVYFFYPLTITLLLFFFGYSLIHSLSEVVEKWILNIFGLVSGGGFLNGFITFFVDIGLKIIFWFLFSMFSKYILLILLSPILALLSEKTEMLLTGKKYSFSAGPFLKNIQRGILMALRNMLIEFAFIISSLLFVFIPMINFLIPVILFFTSAYFYGFSMMDYTNERRQIKISQSVAFIRAHKGTAIANGSIYAMLLWIPFIGIIFAPVFAAVAATISIHELTLNKN